MSIFLKNLAEKVLKNYSITELADLHVILPSTRATLYFKYYLQDITDKTIFLPYTLTLDAFIKKFSQLEGLNQAQLLFRLYKIYRRFDKNESHNFEQFLSLGNNILAEFSLIDRNLKFIESESLFNYWLDISRMEAWGIDIEQFEHDTHLKNHLFFCQNLQKTYFAFRQELLNEKKGYSGLIYRMFADNIENYTVQQPIGKIIFAGFNQIYPAEDLIIKTLIDQKRAQIYWDMDSYYIEDKEQEAGKYFHTYFKKYHPNTAIQDLDFFKNRITTQKKHIRIIKCNTAVGQTVVANHYLQQHIKNIKSENPDYNFEKAVNEIAILLADESLLLPLVNALDTQLFSQLTTQKEDFSFEKYINITMGASLKQTQIFGLIQLIFQLQDHYKKEDNFVFFYHTYIYQFLKHPLIKGESLWTEPIAIFIQNQQEENTFQFAENFLIEKFKDFPILASMFKKWENSQAVFKSLKNLVLYLSRSQQNKDKSLELSSLYETYLILQQLENLERAEPNFFTIKVLKYFFNYSLNQTSVPFTSSPLQAIQIMGTLESRALDFKKLIILSCNEGILPRSKNVDQLIPFEIRRQYKLPTYIENDSNFAYTFYRLLHYSDDITLVYTESKDNEKSRFLLQIEQELSNYKNITVEKKYYEQALPASNPSKLSIFKDATILDSLKLFLKTRLTPSALIMYLHDPIKFFNRYILNLKDETETIENIDHRIFGIIVHDILDIIYKTDTGTISVQSLEKYNLENIEFLINTHVEKEYGKQISKMGGNYIFLNIAKYMIRDFLDFEKQHILPCDILILEDFLNVHLNFKVPCRLSGKIDRIDLHNNQIRIIDYKTGVGNLSFKAKNQNELLTNPDKSKIIQLMLYKYLVIKNKPQFPVLSSGNTTDISSGFYFLRQLNLHKKQNNISSYQLEDEPKSTEGFIAYVEDFLNCVVEDMLNVEKSLGQSI